MKLIGQGELAPERPETGVFYALKQVALRAGAALERGLKAFWTPVNPWRYYGHPTSWRKYSSEVGDGTGSSTVMAPLNWVVRTFPEAPPALWQKMETGEKQRIQTHKLLEKLERPNDVYTGINLWMATVTDYQVDGNAYWWKQRLNTGAVNELWWIPHWLIEPKGNEDDPSIFIDHYDYTANGDTTRIEKRDIVHFRFGLDAENPRLGRAPLKSVLREVFTDDEAAAFTATLLRNMGVPGLIVSPKQGSISPEQASQAKQFLIDQFTGDRRGDPLVQTGPTEIQQFGFSPEELTLRELRRIPEERVTAVMGIPAIVAGLGAGLDRSTFTNMGEAREAAYEAGIIPMQRNLGEDIRFQLFEDFQLDPFQFRFGFDLAEVRVLQEDLTRQAARHGQMVRDGFEKVSEARRAMGMPVDEEQDNVFLRPSNYVTVQADGSTNGNGQGTIDGQVQELVRQAITANAGE